MRCAGFAHYCFNSSITIVQIIDTIAWQWYYIVLASGSITLLDTVTLLTSIMHTIANQLLILLLIVDTKILIAGFVCAAVVLIALVVAFLIIFVYHRRKNRPEKAIM